MKPSKSLKQAAKAVVASEETLGQFLTKRSQEHGFKSVNSLATAAGIAAGYLTNIMYDRIVPVARPNPGIGIQAAKKLGKVLGFTIQDLVDKFGRGIILVKGSKPTTPKSELSTFLTDKITEKFLTIREVALNVGLSKQALFNILNGRLRLTKEVAEKLAYQLGFDFDKFNEEYGPFESSKVHIERTDLIDLYYYGKKQGLTAKGIAKAIDVPFSTFDLWTRAGRFPARLIPKLAEVLKIPEEKAREIVKVHDDIK